MSRFNPFFLAVYLLGIFVGRALACDLIVPSNDPGTVLESSWSNVFTSGSYSTPRTDDNIYWQVAVEYPSGISCSDQSLNGGPYTKRYCQTIQSDDLSTPDVNERELRVVYADSFPLTCRACYQISSGQCVLVAECPADPDPEPELCADGFPPEAGHDLGYLTCDRPALRQCTDDSYVRDDIGICSTVCSDFQTCHDYALSNSSCDGAQNFEFEYQNPENWSFTCTTIDIASPDHPDSGGNADGNPYNDPNTPSTGEGSTPSVGNIDPQSLATAIGSELQDDLSNIERAVRDGLDQSKTNTDVLEVAIGNVADTNNAGFGDVEGAIRDGITSAEGSAEGVRQSVDTLGTKLDQISGQLGDTGPCDPTQPGYLSCLDTPLSNLPSHSTGTATTFAEANASFKTRLDNAPVVVAFNGISDAFNLDNPQCPPFEISFPAPISETISTNIHCDLMDTIAPLISAVMLIIYTVIGFRIFASA